MNLLFVLFLLAVLYVAMAFYDRTRRRNTGYPFKNHTWRRDLTAHETELYREMHAHWRREARKTYRRINYDKKISYGNANQK